MRIAVFGIGYVGAVSAGCLARDGHDVIAVDTIAHKVDLINEGRSPIIEPGLDGLIRRGRDSGRLRATLDGAAAIASADISLVCVGTPSLPNGNLDLRAIEHVCAEIGRALSARAEFHAVVIRSTMLPGSMQSTVVPLLERHSGKRAGDGFGVAIYPEFLREGSAIGDYDDADSIVLGTDDERTRHAVAELDAGRGGDVILCDIDTAALIKYASNAWHATKIVFANEIGAIGKRLGLDGRLVMAALCADRRLNVSAAYLRPGFAFGGSCLPKDLRALCYRARSADVATPLLDSLLASNAQQIQRALDMVEASGGRAVGLFGLSFKGGTDDLRESPAVALAERLIGRGYDLRIFDPIVTTARLTGGNLAFIRERMPHLGRLLTDDPQAVLTHAETLVVTQECDAILRPAGGRPRDGQVIIDLAGLPQAERLRCAHYQGFAW